jgi:hypothetical protein
VKPQCALAFGSKWCSAATHGLDTRQIIDGVCLDPRIGKGIEVVVFEPMLPEASFFGSRVITDLAGKVYTRDLFGGDF